MQIRTESTTDRQRWISRLQQAKSYYEGVLQKDAFNLNSLPGEGEAELNSVCHWTRCFGTASAASAPA